MKTRGKTRVENYPNDYSKDNADSRDPMDDGTDTNGYSEDRTDDGIPARVESRSSRNASNKRSTKLARAGASKGKNDKNFTETPEFREVVQGFFEFIEEINKRKKKPSYRKKNGPEPKAEKVVEETESRKKVKYDTEPPQAQLKFEPQPDALQADKSDKNPLYRFKDEINTGKELLDLISREKEPANVLPNTIPAPQSQEPKPQLWPRPQEATRPKENPLSKAGFPGNMMDFNTEYPNMKFLPNANIQDFNNPLLMKQQQQQPTKQQTPYGYDNNMFKDIMQRIRMQSFPEQNPMRNYYMPSYDNYPKMALDAFGVKPNDLLSIQVLESLLTAKNQPNLLGSLLGSAPSTAGLFGDLLPREYMLQNMGLVPSANQRFGGNQSLGMELIQNDPEVINPKAFEGKLGRAATHVAIAYFIYFKTLDPDVISKSDKNKMDPTFNARMLKEKKYETFPTESAMVNKLSNPGFGMGLSSLGLGAGLPLEYLGNPEIQRLLAQQGLPDQLREAVHFRGMQHGAFGADELNQARVSFQPKNDLKFDDKDDRLENQKKRMNEYKEADNATKNRQSQKPIQTKEEEIIEIKENSEGEVEESKQQAPTDRRANDQIKEKVEETGGNISAEDIVEEITELTNPPTMDLGNRRKKAGVNKKLPEKKGPESGQVPNQKGTSNSEGEGSQAQNGARSDQKPEGQPEQKVPQVISLDEPSPNMQVEGNDGKTSESVKNGESQEKGQTESQ